TKADGTYQLSVSSSTTVLVFSFVGYDQQEVSIKGSSVDIKLVNTNTTLGEVVVTGYGTARKQDLTGSIVAVTSREFIKGSIPTPEQLIAGKVPGVSIISYGGQPGSGSTIRIRGGSSLIARNDPSYVLVAGR